MLRIIIEAEENFNHQTQQFEVGGESITLDLEHSLISLSKWESKYQRPFLSSGKKTPEELFDYIRMMILTPIDSETELNWSQSNINEIQEYIDSPQSATTFGEMPNRKAPGEVITAELIYYWLVAYTIPFQCEYWHLNRLFALIKICNIKNAKPGKKMSRGELARRNAELNARRRQELGTSG